MVFKFGDVIGDKLKALSLPELRCPTGKRAFASKSVAFDVLRSMAVAKDRDRETRRPYRCGFCDKWHIGHRRGAVL